MGEKRFKSRKIYVKDMNGETVRVFDSLKDAAEVYGVSSSTISYWANNGCIKDGYSFEYDPGEEEAKLFGGNPKKPKKPKAEVAVEDVELDMENNHILSYETIGTRVCVTPCPYRINPKPTIGSVQCQCCGRFQGINRKAHEVACKKVICRLN